MIVGIGVDIVEISRVQGLLEKFGNRFIERILTPEEVEEFNRRKCPTSFLASRFSAKEALAKALGTGIGKEVSFKNIQIENDKRGKPGFIFFAGTKTFLNGKGVHNILLSLSDEEHYAVSMVVLES
ncbi:MAG: holo-[acyl-carrier protein] synthase [Gammaproteobacteria bacterium]|jgi:holo-[acyl-carrier protein] synthase